MIVAVGLDLIELERIRGVLERHPERFLTRHFTAGEISYCRSRSNIIPSLAARFAAKEAFQKCWPVSHGWRDVWVEHRDRRPVLCFSEPIEEEMRRQGLVAHLSLTHSRDTAGAVVVLEQR